jgi:hypothetical protein
LPHNALAGGVVCLDGESRHRSNRLGPPYNTSSTPIPQASNGIRLIPKPESNRSATLMVPDLRMGARSTRLWEQRKKAQRAR